MLLLWDHKHKLALEIVLKLLHKALAIQRKVVFEGNGDNPGSAFTPFSKN